MVLRFSSRAMYFPSAILISLAMPVVGCPGVISTNVPLEIVIGSVTGGVVLGGVVPGGVVPGGVVPGGLVCVPGSWSLIVSVLTVLHETNVKARINPKPAVIEVNLFEISLFMV